MNGFLMIRTGTQYRRIWPEDLVEKNEVSREWMKKRLLESFEGKTVVITHNAPLVSCLINKEGMGHLDAAYANDWLAFLDSKVDLWIFGHAHDAVDSEVKGTRLISNSKGYPQQETGFKEGLLVEIG